MSLMDQQWCPTSVQVTALQARGLRIKGKSGTNDAYVVMQVGKEKFQTSVVEKTVAPMWKEEATFDLPLLQGGGGPERSTLHVHVLHRALVGPDKLLGQAVINLLQLSEDNTRNKTEWFKLLDKAGKPDKDRGEVLLDVQFMRNNMTASMFDLSAAGKSRSRLGKFKDKVRGKKKELDPVSVVPSLTQVLTDSEEEDANGDAEGKEGKDKKSKKPKIKSLFAPKSNLQRNMSQSMSVLPAKNTSLSGSQSSGLNVDSSEGKKKFKFSLHKRSGSSDTKDSSFGRQKQAPVEQSNLCINGSHVYCEEPQPRTSRVASSFSLTSSGHISMEEGPESSPPSVGSLKVVRRYSSWMEEEEDEKAQNKEECLDESKEEEEKMKMEEEKRRKEEETLRRQQEELDRLGKEKLRHEEEERTEVKREEEERVREALWRQESERLAEERLKHEKEERVKMEEEERIQKKERQEQEKRKREEEEQMRLTDENRRLEEERKLEEEKRQREEEEKTQETKRLEEEQKLAEEKRLKEEERAEEERRQKEEELVRKDKERRQREEEERLEKEEMRRLEEKVRKEREHQRLMEEKKRQEEEERVRIEKEQLQREEEERKREEMLREQEELEMLVKEKLRREEEERIRKEEEERVRIEKEKVQREEEERKREERLRKQEELEMLVKEKLRREEEERIQKEKEMRQKEEEIIRKEEQERIRQEKKTRKEKEENERLKEMRRLEEEEERVRREERAEKERKEASEEEKRKNKTKREQRDAEIASINPFDENVPEETPDSPEPHGPTDKVEIVQQSCQSAVSSARSGVVDEKDLINAQREKRPAPQPPGRNLPGRQKEEALTRHLSQTNKQSKEKDVKTVWVPPQRSVQVIPPLNRPSEDLMISQSEMQNDHTKAATTKCSKRPAPSRPPSVQDEMSLGSKTNVSVGRTSHRDLLQTKQLRTVHSLNPFEDEDGNELLGQDDTAVSDNTESVHWSSAASQTTDKDAASQSKSRSSKGARAPLPPPLFLQSCDEGAVTGGTSMMVPENDAYDPQREVKETPNAESKQKKVLAGVKEEGPPANSRRLQTVKPLNPVEQQPVQVETDNKAPGLDCSGVQHSKKVDAVITGPYSQLTQEELISLVLKQENQLTERDRKISQLELYIDNLLVRVIEEQPSILMSMSSLK